MEINKINIGEEYCITDVESDDMAKQMLGQKIHLFNKKCNCSGDAFKIDFTGYVLKYYVMPSGEFIYICTNIEKDKYYKWGTRTNWLHFIVEQN